MADKLKPCPFCGGEAEVFDYWNEGKKKNRWVIMCKNCKGGLGELDTEEEAVEKWNNRHSPWHTGAPTEEGDYYIAFRSLLGWDVEYGWATWDGKGWDINFMGWLLSNKILAWQKIEPYKED